MSMKATFTTAKQYDKVILSAETNMLLFAIRLTGREGFEFHGS